MTGDDLSSPAVRLGVRQNLGQFSLLVNAFVGGMVALERTVVPLVGSQEFGLVLKTAIFFFIISFGIVMACALADRIGRSIAIGSVGLLTSLSGVIVAFAMREKRQP